MKTVIVTIEEEIAENPLTNLHGVENEASRKATIRVTDEGDGWRIKADFGEKGIQGKDNSLYAKVSGLVVNAFTD